MDNENLDRSWMCKAFLTQVRLTGVQPYQRSLFCELPSGFFVEVSQVALENGWEPPFSALQISRLVLLSARQTKSGLDVRFVTDPWAPPFALCRGDFRFVPTEDDLRAGLAHLVRKFFELALTPSEFSELVERLALRESSLSTLRTLSSYMLQSKDVDRALYILLSGVTAGYALGFNRAALFEFDESTQMFRGTKGIGPVDASEAHRIWEALELADTNLGDLIEDIEHRRFNTAFQSRIQNLSFSVEDTPEYFQRILETGTLEVLSDPEARQVLHLSESEFLGDEVAFVPLRPHGKLLGMVLADNVFSRLPFTRTQLTYLGIFADQTALTWENMALLKRVEIMAREDALTGVLSRGELDHRMNEEFARCLRLNRPCSLIILDVDHFKGVNDSKGHAAGDDLLKALGKILAETFQTKGIVGRFGGDEFVVIMGDVETHEAVEVARSAAQKSLQAGLSLSIGGATWPDPVADLHRLFSQADENLYRVKRSGRRGMAFNGADPEHFE